ncbi:guanine nucleotide-binding protein beta g protein beta [Anaeramoeba flamelloides]|uniref:Guanine nucleotide-binding protein beta g protein beta n=1 Tax=Anaeramoeba flamelloides TaxID=1746091 RepID=A0ABQ8XMC3_9EUKA|nr:guanine nucleotide-binding protein beta g protein beta [Anaeramoeba flamelloides]
MSLSQQIEEKKKELKLLKEELSNKRSGGNSFILKKTSSNVQSFNSSPVKIRRNLTGHLGKIYGLHWAQDSTRLVSASQDGRLIVWNAKSTNKLHVIPLRSNWIMTAGFAPSGKMVASGGLGSVCSVFDITDNEDNNLRTFLELYGHTGYISCNRFLDDQQILTASGDMTCILWDINSGSKITEFADHHSDVMSLAIKPGDSNIFVSASCDGTSKLWDIRAGNCEYTFKGHQSDVNVISFFPDGNCFGTGSDDATCKLFDIRVGSEVNCYLHDEILSGVSSIGFSLSGRFLFAGYDDFCCYMWDVLKGKVVTILEGHSNKVASLGVSPDGYALCTASWDKEIKIWA